MGELIVPVAVFVVGPLVSAAIVLIARLTDSGLRPTTVDRPALRRSDGADVAAVSSPPVGPGASLRRRSRALGSASDGAGVAASVSSPPVGPGASLRRRSRALGSASDGAGFAASVSSPPVGPGASVRIQSLAPSPFPRTEISRGC